MQNKKRMKTMIAATAMIGVLAIGGISAYFTDGDTATNTFTVGKVSIDLQEPNWNPPKDITPNQEIKKDPQIKNDGINDAYMFMKVTVPYDNITVVAGNGTKAAGYLNTLRARAARSGVLESSYKLTTVTEEDIYDEYARELCGEHSRWALLQRHQAFSTRLAKYNKRAASSFKSYNIWRPISQTFLQQIDNAEEYGDNGYGTTAKSGLDGFLE